jgi:hypothetical protein
MKPTRVGGRARSSAQRLPSKNGDGRRFSQHCKHEKATKHDGDQCPTVSRSHGWGREQNSSTVVATVDSLSSDRRRKVLSDLTPDSGMDRPQFALSLTIRKVEVPTC